jgi:hypothetical protein
MEIIKPYEWKSGTVYGHTKDETKRAWDSAWKFINKIDMIAEFKNFRNENEEYDLYNFRDYIENKYEYSDEIGDLLFNIIGIDEFSDYLKKKYSNFDYWIETKEIHHFGFK